MIHNPQLKKLPGTDFVAQGSLFRGSSKTRQKSKRNLGWNVRDPTFESK